MTGNIEQRIYALARRYNGVYLINNEKTNNYSMPVQTSIRICCWMSTRQKHSWRNFLENLTLIEEALI